MSPGRVFNIVAAICFGIAALPFPAPGNVNLVALGLVFFTLGHMFP